MEEVLYSCRCHLTKRTYYRDPELLQRCEGSFHDLSQLEVCFTFVFKPNSKLACSTSTNKQKKTARKKYLREKITCSDVPRREKLCHSRELAVAQQQVVQQQHRLVNQSKNLLE